MLISTMTRIKQEPSEDNVNVTGGKRQNKLNSGIVFSICVLWNAVLVVKGKNS